MQNIIRTLLYEWKERRLPPVIWRKASIAGYLNLKPGKIIVITGFRRVGKTYLVFKTVEDLLSKHDRQEVVYLNMEDERIPLKTDFLTLLLPTLKEEFTKGTKYLFLDEVQNIPFWSKWLRRIYDTEDICLILTGSNSRLSSREIPTELRGRSLDIVLFPLSFPEFLGFKKVSVNPGTAKYSENERASAVKMLREYLLFGGLPEIVLLPEERKMETAQSYYRTVVQRDVIERYGVRNEEGLKALLMLLLNSTTYTFTKLYHTLKSMQYHIGKTTLQDYVSYLENAYFLYSLPVFSYKAKERLQSPRKAYVIDNVFIHTLSTRFTQDWGRLYENVVFVELLRRHGKENLYYWKDVQHYEVDFVVMEKSRVKSLIQVCYDLENHSARPREMRALLKASKELKCNELLVITKDKDGELEESWFGITRTVRFIPLWQWLLSEAK